LKEEKASRFLSFSKEFEKSRGRSNDQYRRTNYHKNTGQKVNDGFSPWL